MKPHEFFKKLEQSLDQLERQIAQDIVAVEAEQFHAKNFRDEGFTDTVLEKWQPRVDELRSGRYTTLIDASRGLKTVKVKKGEKRKKKRALLVDSSTLKGHALKGRTHGNQVDFLFPLEYERVHNEGGRAGRGAGFQMPKRQYVGESEYLKKRIEAKAKRYMDIFLNNL